MLRARSLIDWVCQPALLAELDIPGWERAMVLGRRHGVSGRWYPALEASGLLERVPPTVRNHLRSDHLVAADRVRSVRWETNRLVHALRDTGVALTLLKGAAYIAAGLAPGHCRMVSDVDILVPFAALAKVEQALKNHGWQQTPQDAYDEHYYREWMHELPPFVHAIRGTSLDVHHNILPRTSNLCPDADALLRRSQALPGQDCRVLAPTDMVLHSVLHGFYGGEFTNCFRDVLDVYELCLHFAAHEDGFWTQLTERALALRAARPLWLALRQAARFPGLAVPADCERQLRRAAGVWPTRLLVEALIGATLQPRVPPSRAERLALKALLLRSHWVKMPLRILVPHLWHKSTLKLQARFEPAEDPGA
jgi:hypothetical protein